MMAKVIGFWGVEEKELRQKEVFVSPVQAYQWGWEYIGMKHFRRDHELYRKDYGYFKKDFGGFTVESKEVFWVPFSRRETVKGHWDAFSRTFRIGDIREDEISHGVLSIFGTEMYHQIGSPFVLDERDITYREARLTMHGFAHAKVSEFVTFVVTNREGDHYLHDDLDHSRRLF